MNENDKRKDKFLPMNKEEFKSSVSFYLKNGNKKISYCKIKNGIYYGGITDSLIEALECCKKFYIEDSNCKLSIGDYSKAVCIWGTEDILYELGILSKEKYDEYINNLKCD